MPASFRFPSNGTQLWLPRRLDPNEPYPGGFNHNAIARLKPGVTVDAAQREFANVLPRVVEVSPMVAPGIPMQMLLDQAQADSAAHSAARRHRRRHLARRCGWSRRPRCSCCSSRARTSPTCCSCAPTVDIASSRFAPRLAPDGVACSRTSSRSRRCSPASRRYSDSPLRRSAFDSSSTPGRRRFRDSAKYISTCAVVAFTLVVATLVAVACSAIPAIRFMRSDALSGLRDGGRGGTVGGKRQRARAVLVAGQMALALVVLAASGLLLRSFQRLRAVHPGFNPDGVATLWLSLPSIRYPGDSSAGALLRAAHGSRGATARRDSRSG